MFCRFDEPHPAIEFARENSLIAYFDPDEPRPAFIAADDADAEAIAMDRRSWLLYEPCDAGGLHVWEQAMRADARLSPNYWCMECHADPPSIAIVGAQGFV